MSQKDFLSQIAADAKKPDSFKEEERVKVEKPKKNIKPQFILIPLLVIVVLSFLFWFLFLRPSIEMPHFIGKTQTEVGQWVVQQEISKNGIIFSDEYSLEYDEGQIINQSVEAGKKVDKNVKIDFILSKGANPDDKVSVPNIEEMDKEEINKWVSDNKLIKTKVMTSYSDTVEKDKVISVEFKGCDRDEFTRGCSLNISVSKGPQPAGTVTVEDFKEKSYAEAESWAKGKKLTVEKVESFSETIAEGMVISQSISKGEVIKEKDKITFTVSKGKGVKVPDFTKMSNNEIDSWIEENTSMVKAEKRYSNNSKYVISQSVTSGSMIGTTDKLELVLNLGSYFYGADEELGKIVGQRFIDIEDWCNSVRYKGIDAYVGQWANGNEDVYSETHKKGTILSVKCTSNSNGKEYDCDGRLPLDVRFSVIQSKGKISNLTIEDDKFDGNKFSEAKIVDALVAAEIPFTNTCNNDERMCELYIDGTKINTNSFSITEGQSIELK